ncbi:uncharacterized protein LOC105279374 [Ooceraea biroi]|uniref:uncharacterized protein LOC105279374 n=1 Tax=Ooceraea biroi TaxID=2015173 RepID=UPI0005BC7ACD|nr:uncharacterized protein LOC105279374 [Ooceraea biroi]
MILRVFNLISFVAFGLCVAKEQMLPVTTCHRDATDYSTCLRDAIQEAWPRFVPGLPDFNFPPIDPAFYDHHNVTYDSGELHIFTHGINNTVSGLGDARFLDVKAYFTDNIFQLEIDMQIPQFTVDGISDVIGEVGPFRVNSTGHYKLVATDNLMRWHILGPVVNDRWIVERFILSPRRIKKVETYLTGFLDSEEFSKLLQDFANEYWPSLLRVVAPAMLKSLEPIYVENTNRLFSNVPFSKVFPK